MFNPNHQISLFGDVGGSSFSTALALWLGTSQKRGIIMMRSLLRPLCNSKVKKE